MPSSNIMSTIWRIYKGVRLFIHVHDDMLRCAHIGSPCSCFFLACSLCQLLILLHKRVYGVPLIIDLVRYFFVMYFIMIPMGTRIHLPV